MFQIGIFKILIQFLQKKIKNKNKIETTKTIVQNDKTIIE